MKQIVAYLPELFFRSKVQEVAKELGLNILCTRDLAKLTSAEFQNAGGFIIDGSAGEAGPIAESLKQLPVQAAKICFLSHVDEERAALLNASGSTVMTKGQFTSRLPAILNELSEEA